MLLRKWRSNSSKLLNSIPPDLHEDNSQVSISPPSQAHKALGLHWDTVCDNLHIAVPSLSVSPGPVTKRMIAARTAGVFDVLGLFSPTVVLARCIFQQTWKLGLSWDSPVPEDIQQVGHLVIRPAHTPQPSRSSSTISALRFSHLHVITSRFL